MSSERWLKSIAGEVRRDGDKKPDWWARASVISGFVSSVVIATVGLAISSSFQKTQLASGEATARAQIEVAKLKNDDDRRLQESRFAADLMQHLLSNEPRHRALAVVMLRRTVPVLLYEEMIGLLASNDPDSGVRTAAIKQLGRSQNPEVAVTLSNISKDKTRAEKERAIADMASTSVAFTGGMSSGICVFLGTSPGLGSGADSSLGGSVFSHYPVEALEGRAGIKALSPSSLFPFLYAAISTRTNGGQSPLTKLDCQPDDTFFQTRETLALVVGLSDYRHPGFPNVAGSRADAQRVAAALAKNGARTSMLVNESGHALQHPQGTRQRSVTNRFDESH